MLFNRINRKGEVVWKQSQRFPLCFLPFLPLPLFARLADILRNYSGRFQQVM